MLLLNFIYLYNNNNNIYFLRNNNSNNAQKQSWDRKWVVLEDKKLSIFDDENTLGMSIIFFLLITFLNFSSFFLHFTSVLKFMIREDFLKFSKHTYTLTMSNFSRLSSQF